MKNKIGQHLIIGLKGTSLTNEESKFIVDNNIGGVILFDRNSESPEQLRQLCLDVQKLRHKLPDKQPLFISIDMEGGRVARLKAPFTRWPAAAKVLIMKRSPYGRTLFERRYIQAFSMVGIIESGRIKLLLSF